MTLAKALPKLKLPVLATAEKELGRIEREEPVVAMLKKALKSKKVFELTAAINAAEALDKTLYEEVRMSASFYIPALKNNSLLISPLGVVSDIA